MKYQRGKSDGQLDCGITEQQIFPTITISARKLRTNAHAAHENNQHQALRVGGVTREEFEVMALDRFVEETADAGQDKDSVQRNFFG